MFSVLSVHRWACFQNVVRQHVFERALTQSRLRRVRLHDRRQTYARAVIQQGESSAYVRDHLAHSPTPVTIDICGHLGFLAELRRAVVEAGAHFARGFRRVPHVLTVRTEETPRPRLLVGEHGLGPVTSRALHVNDLPEPRNSHVFHCRGTRRWSAVSK